MTKEKTYEIEYGFLCKQLKAKNKKEAKKFALKLISKELIIERVNDKNK